MGDRAVQQLATKRGRGRPNTEASIPCTGAHPEDDQLHCVKNCQTGADEQVVSVLPEESMERQGDV
jgi:hypothetical protein